MKIYNELESLGFFKWLSETHNLKDTDMKPEYLDELPLEDIHRTVCNSMVFRWFREKYDLVGWIRRRAGFYKEYSWYISNFNDNDPNEYKFDLHIETYEEAEIACLKKLIEIVKK